MSNLNYKVKKDRQDTKLESEGAEFLVLGYLLIEGITSYKAYINFPGYDLIAINPVNKKIARIQVKSRWATDYDLSFPLKSLDTDFVVHVALNRGYRFNKKLNINSIKNPVFYIFPINILNKLRDNTDWNKVRINKIENLETYINNWNLIKNFLK